MKKFKKNYQKLSKSQNPKTPQKRNRITRQLIILTNRLIIKVQKLNSDQNEEDVCMFVYEK